jgi:hypothetical protein
MNHITYKLALSRQDELLRHPRVLARRAAASSAARPDGVATAAPPWFHPIARLRLALGAADPPSASRAVDAPEEQPSQDTAILARIGTTRPV